ncbi:MAG: metalloregulator ArsR/SmtB family transcription factor [bacterium]
MITGPKNSLEALPVELLERVAAILRLLAHPQRLRLVEFLEGRKEAPVYEIMAHLGISQAVTSQHLNQMKRLGLVRSSRRGREVWYGIADPRCLRILNCIRRKED